MKSWVKPLPASVSLKDGTELDILLGENQQPRQYGHRLAYRKAERERQRL